jgi:hypothetical protein
MIYLKRNGVADIPSEAHDIGLFEPTFQSVTTSYHWTFILWIYTCYTLAMGHGSPKPWCSPQGCDFPMGVDPSPQYSSTWLVPLMLQPSNAKSKVKSFRKAKCFRQGNFLLDVHLRYSCCKKQISAASKSQKSVTMFVQALKKSWSYRPTSCSSGSGFVSNDIVIPWGQDMLMLTLRSENAWRDLSDPMSYYEIHPPGTWTWNKDNKVILG